MKRAYAYYCSVLILAPGLLLAQEAVPKLPPIPPGPLIQTRAPDFAKWVITLTQVPVLKVTDATSSRSEQPPAATGPTTPVKAPSSFVTITKTGSIRLWEATDAHGLVWKTWCTPQALITIRADTGEALIDTASKDKGASTDFSHTDFPDLKVVDLKNYVGIQTVYGAKCLLFKAMIKPDPESPPQEIIDYVNLQTRMPVAVKEGSALSVYLFQPPPTDALELPPQVLQLIKTRNLVNQSAVRHF